MRLLLQPEVLQAQQGRDDAADSGVGITRHRGEKGGEDDPPPSPPPTFEAYLRAEALRLAHQTDLFKLCPKCGEF